MYSKCYEKCVIINKSGIKYGITTKGSIDSCISKRFKTVLDMFIVIKMSYFPHQASQC